MRNQLIPFECIGQRKAFILSLLLILTLCFGILRSISKPVPTTTTINSESQGDGLLQPNNNNPPSTSNEPKQILDNIATAVIVTQKSFDSREEFHPHRGPPPQSKLGCAPAGALTGQFTISLSLIQQGEGKDGGGGDFSLQINVQSLCFVDKNRSPNTILNPVSPAQSADSSSRSDSFAPCCRGGDYYSGEVSITPERSYTVGPFIDYEDGTYSALVPLMMTSSSSSSGSMEVSACIHLTHSLVQTNENPKGPPTFLWTQGIENRTVRTHDRSNYKGSLLRKRRRRWCAAPTLIKCESKPFSFVGKPKGIAHQDKGDSVKLYGDKGYWKGDTFIHHPHHSLNNLYSPRLALLFTNPDAARSAFSQQKNNKKWILFWGDSTLQQTAMNLVEDRFRFPLFTDGTFMNDMTMEKINPVPFYYREWDRTYQMENRNGFRFSYVWGGCRQHTVCCPFCNGDSGFRTVDKVVNLIRSEVGKGVQPPDYIFMGHWGSWESHSYREDEYIQSLKHVLKQLQEVTKQKTQLVWLYPTAESNLTTCHIPNLDYVFHIIHRIEQEVFLSPSSSSFSNTIRINRFYVSYAKRFGNKYAHNGNHYGMTTALCKSYMGRSSDKYKLQHCARNVAVDEVFQR
eukprot:PhF_6_TR42143/c1_g1_i1/m.63674